MELLERFPCEVKGKRTNNVSVPPKKMMIRLLFLASFSVLFGTSLLADESVKKSWEALSDTKFSKGFVLSGPLHASPTRNATFGQKDEKPEWRIAQWDSKGLLDRVLIDDDTVKLTDDYKSVTLNRKTGAINLAMDTLREYESPRTSPHQPWACLLLDQMSFQKPIKVSEAAEIWVEADFELTENKAHGPQNPDLHTAQLVWVFYMKNTNRESKGYRDFLWFCLQLFDSRYDFAPDFAMQDFNPQGAQGNGHFIRLLGSKRYFDKPVVVGERQTLRYDIRDAVQEAIEVAHKHGFIVNTTIDDVILDGTNIGWEVPGTYDVGATLYKMSVQVMDR